MPQRPPTAHGARSGSASWVCRTCSSSMQLPFDSDEARALSPRASAEDIYFHALWASTELAEQSGPHAGLSTTPARGRRAAVRPRGASPRATPALADAASIASPPHGLRNSLLIAIAPTATIASIAGCYECIEPQVSNLFKRETLSGEFLQINRYLVRDLQRLGLWDERHARREAIKRAEGSVQDIDRASPTLNSRIGSTARRGRSRMRALIDMAAERGAVHRPEPVAQPLHGVARHRQALVDVPARLEGRAQDHVLPALPPGHAHQPDQQRRRRRPRGGGEPAPRPTHVHGSGGLLAREPRRVLRSLPSRGGRRSLENGPLTCKSGPNASHGPSIRSFVATPTGPTPNSTPTSRRVRVGRDGRHRGRRPSGGPHLLDPGLRR